MTQNLIINQKSKTDEGLVISGVASTNKRDRQHEIITITPNALKKAWPEFAEKGAPMQVEHARFARYDNAKVKPEEEFNPRIHYWVNPKYQDRVVGKVINMEFENADEFDFDSDEPQQTKITFVALVTDPEAIADIENGELDFVSLGWGTADWWGRYGESSERFDKKIKIKELSLAKIPANPDTVIESFHKVTGSDLEKQFFPKGELVATKTMAGKVEEYFRDDWGEVYVKLSNHKSLVRVDKIEKSRPGPKSEAQTPAEPDEQVDGSDQNPEGSATTESDVDIELSETTEKALEKKVKEHNEQYPDKRVTKDQLEKVWRRGAGAFSTSHRPGQSRHSWAMARVNTFLDMAAGKKVKDSYREADGDLLSKKNALLEQFKAMVEYNKRTKRKKVIKALFGNQKSQTFDDYPKSAREAAKKVLRWREEHGDEVKGMTRKGWARARQLAEGRPVDRKDLGEIASFARHKQNAEIAEEFRGEPWKDNGYVAWLGWGGDSMISWAQRKLKQLEKEG
jgi:hypothetical protein